MKAGNFGQLRCLTKLRRITKHGSSKKSILGSQNRCCGTVMSQFRACDPRPTCASRTEPVTRNAQSNRDRSYDYPRGNMMASIWPIITNRCHQNTNPPIPSWINCWPGVEGTRPTSFDQSLDLFSFSESGWTSRLRAIHGSKTLLKIIGSGHTFTCLPKCPPEGLIHASLGTSPALISS